MPSVAKSAARRVIKQAAWLGGLIFCLLSQPTGAADLPGAGRTVTPCYDSTDESLFQTNVIIIGLEKLGYKVSPSIPLNVLPMYLAVASGDATFTAAAWDPLQNAFYLKAGGDEKLQHIGALVAGATQGYFIDRKTASANHITSIEQLKDPKIAAVFSDGASTKAQLIGCPPGWGCERVIEHQLTAYGLRPTVEHVQGDMAVLASEVINRFKEGKPVLYYTYTPLWLSQVLVPGKDVDYLTVPFTSLPDKDDHSVTVLPDGRNVGFSINVLRVAANSDFLKANPAAKTWFEQATIPIADVNAENYQIYQGEKSLPQIRQHAEKWVADHQAQVDTWLAAALQAR